MDVSELLHRVRTESVEHAHRQWSSTDGGSSPAVPAVAPGAPAWMVRFEQNGWVQEFDAGALLRCVPVGGTLRLDTYPGPVRSRGHTLGHDVPADLLPADLELVRAAYA